MRTSLRQVQNPNVIINSLIIRTNSAGLVTERLSDIDNNTPNYEIDLFSADQKTDSLSFYSLSFVEDINEPHLTGVLTVVDTTNIFDHLGISSTGEIEIDLSFYDTIIGDVYTTSNKKLFFNIADINVTNDIASQDVTRGSGTPNYIVIKFSSKEFINSDFISYNFAKTNVKSLQNFIGPISDNYKSADDIKTTPIKPKLKVTKKQQILNAGTEDEKTIVFKDEYDDYEYTLENDWQPETPTFFGNLIDIYNKERTIKNRPSKKLEAHKTHNDVWIKPQYFFYPGYRLSNVPRITQLINYVKTYSCLKEDPNIVDFMFWEDLDGYNFKSIAKMVKESVKDPLKRFDYWPDVNPNNLETIVSMEVLRDVDPVELIHAGALTSEYVRVKPDWSNPFRSVVSDKQFVKKLVKYNYKEDILEYTSPLGKPANDVYITNKIWENTQGYSPFTNKNYNLTSKKGDFDSGAFRVSDEIYGFYNIGTHNSTKAAWWLYLDKLASGFTWESNLYTQDYNKDGSGLTYDFGSMPRLEQEYWQSQFDFCELPGSGAYLIYKHIKWPLNKAREEYIKAKNINEQWKFYFDNICCERKMPLNFFALITGAKKIYGGDGVSFDKDPGGIYAYDWVEVEFWPRDSATALLKEGDQLIKFADYESYPFVFVKPKGALEGHSSITKQYVPKITPRDPTNKQYADQRKEYLTPDTTAYNINEILNTAGITLSSKEYSNLTAELKNSIEACRTLITNPGISVPLERYTTDPSSLSDGCKTSYPTGFSMMPVGHFRYLNDCENEKLWNFGRIVQMNVIPREIMQTIVKGESGITGITGSDTTKPPKYNQQIRVKSDETEESVQMGEIKEKKEIKYMFLFDVVNAHDGLCDGTCSI